MYNFKEVEKKWQDKWFNEKSFKAVDFHPTKSKYYVLYEFYNISGNLHMGHLKGTVPADALSRMKRLQGCNVLFQLVEMPLVFLQKMQQLKQVLIQKILLKMV